MNEQRGKIMDFMTKEEFINESNGIYRQFEDFDISSNVFLIITKRNMIEKAAKGIYIDSTKIEDVYYVLSV